MDELELKNAEGPITLVSAHLSSVHEIRIARADIMLYVLTMYLR